MNEEGVLDYLEQGVTETEQKDSELKLLSNMVKRLDEKRKSIALIEHQLSEEKEGERKMSEEEIPNLMLSKNLMSITTEDGFKVTIKEELRASLPKKDEIKRSTALKWILGNGGESIIKERLEVEDPEEVIKAYLREQGVPFRFVRDIHNRTLVSFMKGLLGMTKGSLQTIELSEIPLELNPYSYKKTTIK